MCTSNDTNLLTNRKCVLAKRPKETPFSASEHSKIESETVYLNEIKDDEVVVKVDAIGVDAFIRVMLDNEHENGGKNKVHGGIEVGDVIPAIAIGTVLKSGNGQMKPGKTVSGLLGGQTYATVKQSSVRSVMKIPRVPNHKFLSLFSISGITAYVGTNRVLGAPRKGETVVVSAAAGATGSIAAQLAKVNGARVIGIAGGEEKARFLVNELGLDGSIDYKHPTKSLKEQFDELCPDGIDFFYDNVGGDCLNEVLAHVAKHGRVVLCGAISQYHKKEKQGPSNYIRLSEQSATMSGFVVTDYPVSMGIAFVNLLWLYCRGKVKSFEQMYEGIEEFPRALQGLFEGGNIGKPVVTLD